MKFSLAAALLGQTVPTLAKQNGQVVARDGGLRLNTEIRQATSPQSSIVEHDDDQRGLQRSNRRLMRHQKARHLKNAPSVHKAMMVPCDPRSTDADIGILSCGDDHICEPSSASSLGGVCTPLEHQGLGGDSLLRWKGPLVNHFPSVATTGKAMVPCDPALLDIGILACEGGQYCMNDETSELGGFCVDSFVESNRRLVPYYIEDYLNLCVSDPYEICDCSGVNDSTGTGTIYCSQNRSAQSIQGCDEYVVYNFFSYSFNNSVLVKASDCYETTIPFMESICFSYDFDAPEPSCSTEWNDQLCNSCVITNYSVAAFDCSNVGGLVGNSRKEMLSVFDLCANTTCTNVCGEGSYIPDVNIGINITVRGYNSTCGELTYAEENELLGDTYCPLYAEIAQSYCCVSFNATSSGGNATSPPDEDSTDGSSARLLRAWHP